MKSPVEWNAILRAPRAEAMPAVVETVKSFLDENRQPIERNISTYDLVEWLYPEHLARGENITARKRLFKLLLESTDLEGYYTLGEPEKGRFGRSLRRRLWHARVKRRCPHCNGELED